MTTAVAGIQHSFPPHIHRVFEDKKKTIGDHTSTLCPSISLSPVAETSEEWLQSCFEGGGAGVLKEA